MSSSQEEKKSRICKRGHEAIGRSCRECKKITGTLYYEKHIDKKRQQARARAAKQRVRACKRGHENVGYPCPECRKITFPLWYQETLDKRLEQARLRARRYIARNRQLSRDRRKAWRAANPEKDREIARKQYEANREKQLAANLAWRKANPKRVLAISAARKAAKLQRTPAWADLRKIKEIYQGCPKGFQVDHIVPLRGKTVCGFHVEYNLQYLSALENRRKKNRLLPEGVI